MSYIALPRELFDELWSNQEFTKPAALVDLWQLANYKDSRFEIAGRIYEAKRGQVCRSIVQLSARWGWSRAKVKRFLNDLETLHQIEHQTEQHFTRITICNYWENQSDVTPDVTPDETGNVTPDVTPDVTHKKKDKKNKKTEGGENAPRTRKSKIEVYREKLSALDWSKWPFGKQPDSEGWSLWMAVRCEKRGQATQIALDMQRDKIVEAVRAGYDAEDIYRLMAARGWVSFELEMAQKHLKPRTHARVAPIQPLVSAKPKTVCPEFADVLKGMTI